jgi:hypothetical protein
MESKLQAIICRTEEEWDELTFDIYYWRKVPDAEYDAWVDRCEALDQQIESFLDGVGYNDGAITNWRDRTLEFDLSELSDEHLSGLQKLLVNEYRDWRIAIMVWSELDQAFEEYPDIRKSKHEGTIMIGHDFFMITDGLADYFPLATA